MTAPLLSVEWIPSGDAGAVETLLRMRGLVQAALRDPVAVAQARRLVPEPSIDAIAELLTDRVRFREDPPLLEYLQAPRALLDAMRTRGRVTGDCDDVAVLAAFLGAVHGLPYRFRAVGFSRTGPLLHVYTLLRADGAWRTLDTTRSRTQAPPVTVRALELDG